MSNEPADGRLHIDSDWKEEAQREKQRIAEQETAAGPTTQPGAAGIADLVNMLAMQAAVGIGGYQGPGGERIPPNLDMAKHHIDMLDVLDQKTSGNLTADEKRILDTVLYELRTQYVQVVGSGAASGGPGGAIPPTSGIA